jgi:hypothetical protein
MSLTLLWRDRLSFRLLSFANPTFVVSNAGSTMGFITLHQSLRANRLAGQVSTVIQSSWYHKGPLVEQTAIR